MLALLCSNAAFATKDPICKTGLRHPELLDFYQGLAVNSEVESFIAANPGYTAAFPEYENPAEAYFNGRVASDWINIKPLIPRLEDGANVLDIGSGIGGINILIGQRYGAGTHITLVDKSDRQGSSVIEEGVKLVSENAPGTTVRGLEPGSPEILDRQYDLIISMRGLAYMFPYSFYAEEIKSQLKMGGILILDVAKRQDEGSSILEDRFGGSSYTQFLQVVQELSATIGSPAKIREGADLTRFVIQRTIP